jgi:hypothetical protein
VPPAPPQDKAYNVNLTIAFAPGVQVLQIYGFKYEPSTDSANTYHFFIPPLKRLDTASVFIRFSVPRQILAALPQIAGYSWEEDAGEDVRMGYSGVETTAGLNLSPEISPSAAFTDVLITNASAVLDIADVYWDRTLENFTRLSYARSLVADSLKRIAAVRALSGNETIFQTEYNLFSMYDSHIQADIDFISSGGIIAPQPDFAQTSQPPVQENSIENSGGGSPPLAPAPPLELAGASSTPINGRLADTSIGSDNLLSPATPPSNSLSTAESEAAALALKEKAELEAKIAQLEYEKAAALEQLEQIENANRAAKSAEFAAAFRAAGGTTSSSPLVGSPAGPLVGPPAPPPGEIVVRIITPDNIQVENSSGQPVRVINETPPAGLTPRTEAVLHPAVPVNTEPLNTAQTRPVPLANIKFYSGNINTIQNNPNTVFKLQFGAYTKKAEADAAVAGLKSAGIASMLERYQTYYRVIVPSVKGKDALDLIRKAGLAGFTSVWLRPVGQS